MATVTSNLPQINALLNSLADALDLTNDGLGEDLLGVVVEGLVDRNAAQLDPAGADWAANKEPYASSPRKAGKPVGVLTGEMLSMVQLAGEKEITSTKATMTYGVNQDARDKSDWFTAGRAGVQEPREFYALDPAIEAKVTERAEEALTRIIEGLG